MILQYQDEITLAFVIMVTTQMFGQTGFIQKEITDWPLHYYTAMIVGFVVPS